MFVTPNYKAYGDKFERPTSQQAKKIKVESSKFDTFNIKYALISFLYVAVNGFRTRNLQRTHLSFIELFIPKASFRFVSSSSFVISKFHHDETCLSVALNYKEIHKRLIICGNFTLDLEVDIVIKCAGEFLVIYTC